MSWFFASGGQNIVAPTSASVLPIKIQICFIWDWLVWSPCSPRDSQESSSSNTVQKHKVVFSLPYLEKAMAPYSSTLAWKIHWTEEPGGLQSMWSLRVRNNWATFTFTFHFFFSFIFISWRIIDLQYCSGFCHTWTWISPGFTCVPYPESPSHLPPHPILMHIYGI